VVDDNSSKLNIKFMFGIILDIYKASIRSFQNFKISFIKRQVNNVAYILVRVSLSYHSFHIHEYMSSCIETIIIDEMGWFCFYPKRKCNSQWRLAQIISS